MPTIESIITEKVKRLESVPDKFVTSVERSQKEVLKKLISDLSKLDRVGDKIDITNANILKIEEIGNELKKILFDGDYVAAVKDFASEIIDQGKLTQQFFKKAFPDDFTNDEIFKNILKVSQEQAISLFSEEAVSQELIQPLKSTLLNAITTGADVGTTTESLMTLIDGDKNIDGLLTRYAKTYAKDAFSTTDRQYTTIIGNELDVQWYVYRGGELGTTRPFCKHLNGQYMSKQEVVDLGNGIDLDGSKLTADELKGRAAGTNGSTIFTFAGGYNCEHSFLPTSIGNVPKTVIERNIEKGYYEEK